MFGNNLISKPDHGDGLTLAVQEIFYTLQGEGPFGGLPAVFIRLAGCNLACAFCDTQFDSGLNNRLGIDQIMKQVESFPHNKLVVLTGGEPLRQNILPLLGRLTESGRTVQIETAGTLWIKGLSAFLGDGDSGQVVIVVSPKTPTIHPAIHAWASDFKYVIEAGRWDPEDGLPIYGTQPSTKLKTQMIARPRDRFPLPSIWVSPCDAYDKDANHANMMAARDVALTFGYRLNLQVHKIVKLP